MIIRIGNTSHNHKNCPDSIELKYLKPSFKRDIWRFAKGAASDNWLKGVGGGGGGE